MNHLFDTQKLFTVAVDGHGDMIAFSPTSGIEIARVRVLSDSTAAHTTAARELANQAFASLEAEGYAHAYGAAELQEVPE